MEISGPAPLGTKAAYAVPVQDTRPPDLRKVQPQTATTDAGADGHERPEQDVQAAASRDILALRRAVAQGRRAAGPPPSFEVSLLEVESDLQQKLARMEAERSQARDAPGVQGRSVPEPAEPVAPTPEAAPADTVADRAPAAPAEGD